MTPTVRNASPRRVTLVLVTTLHALLAGCGDAGITGPASTGGPGPVTGGSVDPPTTTDPTTTLGPGTTTVGPTTGTSTTPGTDTAPITGTGTGSTTLDEPCAPGTIVCDGEVAKVCDGLGGFESQETCPKACAPSLGCVECVPGEGICEGAVARTCDEQGQGYVDTVCDDVQGVVCEAGACVGACTPALLGTSYIGCEYYAVVTPNLVFPDYIFSFAVVVSNVSEEDADVTITRGDAPVLDILVPSNTVEVVPLPWLEGKYVDTSQIVANGAYRIRSTQPVTLYQYSPLDYQKNGEFSYSNDASLLMPTNVWGTDTMAIARNTFNGSPGAYAVVAREDGTQVTVTPSATGGIIIAGGGIAADGTGTVMLDAGDVLEVISGLGGGSPDVADVTGTRVASDKPVMVIGAHNCTFIPYDLCCCDHLEEINLPVENLAKEYLVTTPLVKPFGMDPFIKARRVRMVATADGTTLTYDPPQEGAPATLAKAGDYAEVQTDKDFKITANFKIAVSEYLLSQQAGGDAGDPAMTISVPLEQYRKSYSFHAPTNYESNFINVTAPNGAQITLDGAPLAGFTPIGGTGFGIARVELSNAGDGDHSLVGDLAFGVQVYGYGQYTSYWYPGGLNLDIIPQ